MIRDTATSQKFPRGHLKLAHSIETVGHKLNGSIFPLISQHPYLLWESTSVVNIILFREARVRQLHLSVPIVPVWQVNVAVSRQRLVRKQVSKVWNNGISLEMKIMVYSKTKSLRDFKYGIRFLCVNSRPTTCLQGTLLPGLHFIPGLWC